MMENMLLAQQKQDEYIKQFASKVDVLTTHNKMLEAQIAQQATSLSTPLGTFPSKNELSLREHCNAMNLRGGKQHEAAEGISIDETLNEDVIVEKELYSSSHDVHDDVVKGY